jgi:mono/diheme cytochrome c family protein
MRSTFFAIALVSLLSASACSKGEEKEPAGQPTTTTTTTTTTTAPTANPEAQAKEIFATRCTPCHGAEGRGDGAASASLNPKPRNFHDPAWQQSVQDDYLIQIIKMGGAAVGKNAAMPGNPDLKDPAVLAALKDHIRSLGKQP